MSVGIHVNYSLSSKQLNLNFLDGFLIKPQIPNFIKIRPMGPEFLHVDGRTELIFALRNSVSTPIKVGKWVLRSSELLCTSVVVYRRFGII